MAGAQIQIRADGVAAIDAYLQTLARQLGRTAPLLNAVGGLVESQTRRRIAQDKEGPNGEPWSEWSARYAATRRGGHSLLESEGLLVDSIHFVVGDDGVEVGSGLVYAAIQQFGGAEVGRPNHPARPFLGIGTDDTLEILDVLSNFGRAAIGGAA